MNTLNFNKNNNIIMFFGMFLILIINQLLDVSLFISKILSIYIFDNLNMVTYLFFIFVLIIFFLEITFLRRKHYFTIINLKNTTILLILLYFLNYITIYIEGNILSIYVAENYERDEFLSFQMAFSYSKAIFTIHNFSLIVYALIKVRKQKG